MQVDPVQLNGLALDALALLATYALHSSLLFGAAWLVGRAFDSPRLRELLWKGALIGGLVTTGIQAVLGGGPLTIDYSNLPGATPVARESGGDAGRSVIGIHGASIARVAEGVSDTQALNPATKEQGALGLKFEQLSKPKFTVLWPLGLFLSWTVVAGIGLRSIRRERRALLSAPRTPVNQGPLREQLRPFEHRLGREIRLWSAPNVSSPMAIGRSELCVPIYALNDLDEPSQRALLAHEVEHLRRRDGAWLYFARVLQAIFPFQPLQRLAISRMGHEAELLCDEAALRATGDGVALARCLVLVAERLTGPALPSFSVAMATQSSPLMHRVQRVLGPAPSSASRSGVILLGAIGGAALLTLACAGPAVSVGSKPTGEGQPVVGARDANELPLVEGDLRVQLVIDAQGARSVHWLVNGITLARKDALEDYMLLLGAQDASRTVTVYTPPEAERADIEAVLGSMIAANFTTVRIMGTGDKGEEMLALSQTRSDSEASRPAVRPEAIERLAALGYVTVEPKLPDPAIVVQIKGKGSVRVNDKPLAIVSEHALAAVLKPLAQELTRTPLAPNSDLMLVKEPLRITADAKALFSHLQLIMMACGNRDVSIPNLQLDLEFMDGSREIFAYALPTDLDGEHFAEEEEENGEGQGTGSSTPTIRFKDNQWIALVPGKAAHAFDPEDIDGFKAGEFLAYLNRSHSDRRQRIVTLEFGLGSTVAEVAPLLHVLNQADLMGRTQFTGTVWANFSVEIR